MVFQDKQLLYFYSLCKNAHIYYLYCSPISYLYWIIDVLNHISKTCFSCKSRSKDTKALSVSLWVLSLDSVLLLVLMILTQHVSSLRRGETLLISTCCRWNISLPEMLSLPTISLSNVNLSDTWNSFSTAVQYKALCVMRWFSGFARVLKVQVFITVRGEGCNQTLF